MARCHFALSRLPHNVYSEAMPSASIFHYVRRREDDIFAGRRRCASAHAMARASIAPPPRGRAAAARQGAAAHNGILKNECEIFFMRAQAARLPKLPQADLDSIEADTPLYYDDFLKVRAHCRISPARNTAGHTMLHR